MSGAVTLQLKTIAPLIRDKAKQFLRKTCLGLESKHSWVFLSYVPFYMPSLRLNP